MILIGFNPDAFIDKNGKKHLSCFKYHKTCDMPIIADEDIWNMRLDKLRRTIKYHINNVPIDPMTVEYLFYSENIFDD